MPILDSFCAWQQHEIGRHEDCLDITTRCADHVEAFAAVVTDIGQPSNRRPAGRARFHPIDPVTEAWLYDPTAPEELGHRVPVSEYRRAHPPSLDPRPFSRRRRAWREAELSQSEVPRRAHTAWTPPPSFDLDNVPASVAEGHAFTATVERAECMTSHRSGTGVTLERDHQETDLMVVTGTIHNNRSPCAMLVDGGSKCTLIDSSVHHPRELAAAGIRVEPVQLCLTGITGRGPAQHVHRAYDVPISIPGAGVKVIPQAYVTDLSHLEVSVLLGKPTLARWGAIEDHANASLSFPDGTWRSSSTTDSESEWCHYGGVETVSSATAANLLRENEAYEIIEVRLDQPGPEMATAYTTDAGPAPTTASPVATAAVKRWATSEPEVRQAVLDRFSAMDPELAEFLQQYECVTTVCQMPPFDPDNTPPAAQHRVRLKPGHEEHLRRAPVYPMSTTERAKMRKQLDYLLRRNLIQPSAENSASPAFFIRKRAGAGEKTGTTKLRLIIDMRNLNEHCYRDATPLPSVADIFHQIGNGNHFFSNLDLIHAYWNCAVETTSQKYLAFNTPHGQFSWHFSCSLSTANAHTASQPPFCRRRPPRRDDCSWT